MLKLNLIYINDLNNFLKEIDDDMFVTVSSKHLFSGSIGAHARHVIEFYGQFLISFKNNLIDYDSRERNVKIETNKQYAILHLEKLIHAFDNLLPDDNEILNCRNNGQENKTSVGRELSYLSEHTIHHFALMRLIAESEGFNFIHMPDFGIARSTLAYRTSQNH